MSDSKTPREILEATRAYFLADPGRWTHYLAYADEVAKGKGCLLQRLAIEAGVYYPLTSEERGAQAPRVIACDEAKRLLARVVGTQFIGYGFNDHPDTTFEKIIEALDAAIALASEATP